MRLWFSPSFIRIVQKLWIFYQQPIFECGSFFYPDFTYPRCTYFFGIVFTLSSIKWKIGMALLIAVCISSPLLSANGKSLKWAFQTLLLFLLHLPLAFSFNELSPEGFLEVCRSFQMPLQYFLLPRFLFLGFSCNSICTRSKVYDGILVILRKL